MYDIHVEWDSDSAGISFTVLPQESSSRFFNLMTSFEGDGSFLPGFRGFKESKKNPVRLNCIFCAKKPSIGTRFCHA